MLRHGRPPPFKSYLQRSNVEGRLLPSIQPVAQHDGGANAPEDNLAALLQGDASRGHADHDCVVAGQHEIDRDDLAQCSELRSKFSIEMSYLWLGHDVL